MARRNGGRELRLGDEACRLVGLDPDQLGYQNPYRPPHRISQLREEFGRDFYSAFLF
jgi:hypothetical protein